MAYRVASQCLVLICWGHDEFGIGGIRDPQCVNPSQDLSEAVLIDRTRRVLHPELVGRRLGELDKTPRRA